MLPITWRRWCIEWKFEFWNRSWCDKSLQMWQASRVCSSNQKNDANNVATLICRERSLLTETVRNRYAHSRLNDSGVEKGFEN